MAKKQAEKEDTFTHRQAAWNWLRENGHKVGKSTFYQACGNGFPSLRPDGSVPRHEVIRFAQTLDKSTVADPGFPVQKEKLQLQNLQLDIDKKIREARKDDDRWLYRDEAYAQMAAFFGTLVDSLNHHFLTGMDEMVDTMDGNISLKEQGYELAEEIIGRACNEVCAMGQINRVLVKGPA